MQEKKCKKLCSVSCSFICILIISLLMFTACNLNQNTGNNIYSIRGTVTAENDSSPIEGVRVSVKGTSVFAMTDANGNYELNNVPGKTVTLQAEKDAQIMIPDFTGISNFSGYSINVLNESTEGIVTGANFTATDELTIAMIQGKGHMSPLEGTEVKDITGVVTYVGNVRAHYKFDTSTYDKKDGMDQCVGEDGFYMQMTTPDGNPLTSDGIFVNTRNPQTKNEPSETAWLSSCKPNGKYPKPGDIVTVSGIVEEYRPVDRFNEALGNLTRTQINATSVKQTGETQSIGNGVVLTYTSPSDPSVNPDSIRVIPYNTVGLDSLAEVSLIFESVEGMLVRVNDPIVTGGTYYNFTAVMADGGHKDNDKNSYPEPFNKKWLAPVVRENDFNTEQIHVFWDNKEYDKPNNGNAQILCKLPQLGTVLSQDNYNAYDESNVPYLTGVMDYVADGNYIIYPYRLQDMNSNVPFKPHDEYNFVVHPDSFYSADPAITNFPTISALQADTYQPWIYGTGDPKESTGSYPIQQGVYNEMFSVPWDMEEKGSTSPLMSVAVFNMENYINGGYISIKGYPSSRKAKADNVARAIVKSMKCPDIIFVVEMGDDDDSSGKIHYNNQDHSWLSPTGTVSARKNFTGLINVIEEFTRTDASVKGSGIQYDYRQIDPIEFDQAGSPGNNIRVGFLFRTDRIKAADIGLATHHMGYCPTELVDKPRKEETALTTLAKAHANLIVLGEGEDKELTLTQSPGYIQNGAFYHSRIPLISKFTFLPGDENEQDFFGIAAHLYSKGPDAPLYGDQQPPVFTSEIRRGNQALALNSYLKEIQRLDPDAMFIVGGDMNDFGYSPAIKKLTGEFNGNQILHSLTEQLPEDERFTYYFRGNLQQLDHIFVSKNMFDRAAQIPLAWEDKVYIPHIDSLFSRNNHIQISDHDPVVALIDMSK